MEYIFEFLLELILEGSIEASRSNKIPKYIRYPLIVLIVCFFVAVIGLIFFAGILFLKESLAGGIFFLLIGLLLLVSSIIQFRKTYLIKKDQNMIK